MAMEWKSSDFNTKLEIICGLCKGGKLIKRQNKKAVWIKVFGIDYNTEEQRENMVHTKHKQTNSIPFFHEHTLVKFVLRSPFETV